jgi:hypothetical protein
LGFPLGGGLKTAQYLPAGFQSALSNGRLIVRSIGVLSLQSALTPSFPDRPERECVRFGVDIQEGRKWLFHCAPQLIRRSDDASRGLSDRNIPVQQLLSRRGNLLLQSQSVGFITLCSIHITGLIQHSIDMTLGRGNDISLSLTLLSDMASAGFRDRLPDHGPVFPGPLTDDPPTFTTVRCGGVH